MSAQQKVLHHPTAKIHPTAIVSRAALIEGDVTIGPGCVVHPFASILATSGPMVLGENCSIEERSLIENVNPDLTHVMNIGNENIFEPASVCRAVSVGSNNIFGIKCQVGKHCSIGDGCSIGAKCELLSKETLPDRTVIYADNQRRIGHENPPAPELDTVRKLLPNFHFLQKTKI